MSKTILLSFLALPFHLLAQSPPDISDPRFKALFKAYELDLAAKNQDAEAKIQKLNQQLLAALERDEKKAMANADLDGVTAIRAEKQRLQQSGELPASDSPGTPQQLKRLRIAWRAEKAKIDAEQSLNAAPVRKDFVAKLEGLEKTLTREGKIGDALAVRTFRTKLSPTEKSSVTAASDGWTSLFNGRDLTGWVQLKGEPGCFTITNGHLSTQTKEGEGTGYLFVARDGRTPDTFKNFELKVVVQCQGEANSGIYFHTSPTQWRPPDRVHPAMGYEIQISNDTRPGRGTGGLHGIQPVDPSTKINHEEWNEVLLRVEEKRITCDINGQNVLDYIEPDQIPKRRGREGARINPDGGAITIQALSIHGAVLFKSIEIRELP